MKDKRRNTEKRKEKSRDAARCRRSKESEVFFELAESLPLPDSVTSQLDKASVMRLAISFLKLGEVLEHRNWSELENDDSKGDEEGRADQLFPKALDGFVFILSNDGDIVYINETVAKYLGIPQIELMGQSIFEFTHPRDEDEIREVLSSRPQGPKSTVTEERMFFLRLKCTLTAKGRNVNLKSASYKVIKCTGRLVTPPQQGGKAAEGAVGGSPYLMAIGEPIPHPANIEMPMDNKTFLSKHDMNMRFTYCDERVKELVGYESDDLEGKVKELVGYESDDLEGKVKELVGYESDDLEGKSVYDYHHAMDSGVVEKAYKDLLGRGKGQMMTGQYRFLAQGGGWVWLVTQATVIYNNRNQKAQWVVCVHYVLSEVEEKDLVLSEVQVPASNAPLNLDMNVRAVNMESIFSEIDNNVTKSEEDLDFLAPTAGEGSVPLGFPSLAQVIKHNEAEYHLPFASPIPPNCAGVVPMTLKESVLSLMEMDRCASSPPVLLTVDLKREPSLSPALCRTRDMIREAAGLSPASSASAASSRMGSPYDYKKAASPNDILSMDRFFQDMDTKADDVVDKDAAMAEVNCRAPYIPMNGTEDLSLLPPSSESLITLQNDMDPGLFGKTECVFKPKREDIFEDSTPEPPRKSVRDMIGGSTAVASIEQPPNTMFQQIKRPLDMNSLEKGPPAPKIPRITLGHNQINKVPTLKGGKESVLLNLLLTGEDPNGYRVFSPAHSPSPSVSVPLNKNIPSRVIQSQLLRLTTRDFEVNAPTQAGGLLQGSELLKALEIGVPPTPR
ncbi:hypothetical protein ACOMHN_008369 [Nucella lapillus]